MNLSKKPPDFSLEVTFIIRIVPALHKIKSCDSESELFGFTDSSSSDEGVEPIEHEVTYIFSKNSEEDRGVRRFVSKNSISLFIEQNFSLSIEIHFTSFNRSLISSNMNNNFNTNTGGYVGLRNQGATCYMNSFLQYLFHLSIFREAVYKIPFDNFNSIPFALQLLFYRMQTENIPVDTVHLTRSFGWNDSDAFTQHDVVEFAHILLDTIEEKTKRTPANDIVAQLFKGRCAVVIRCLEVNYQSVHCESFYDLSLEVKGCSNLIQSIDQYCQSEKLEGANQYRTSAFGSQDAIKYVRFISFPPVIQFHLKRFDYNVKIDDRFEFPVHLDLTSYLVSPIPPDHPPALYTLFAVLVHSGSAFFGHYNIFIDPQLNGNWFKFNDEMVIKVSENHAVESNFGGKEINGLNLPSFYRSMTSAYMLVYIRNHEKHFLSSVSIEIIPKDLSNLLADNSKVYIDNSKMRLITISDLDKIELWSLIGYDNLHGREILLRSLNPLELARTLEKETGISIDLQDIWLITDGIFNSCIVFRNISLKNEHVLNRKFVTLFIRSINSKDDTSNDIEHQILLFFRYFDISKQTSRLITSLKLNMSSAIKDIEEYLRDNIGSRDEFRYYSETGRTIDPNIMIRDLPLERGDVIWFNDWIPASEKSQTLLNKIPIKKEGILLIEYNRPYCNSSLQWIGTLRNEIPLELLPFGRNAFSFPSIRTIGLRTWTLNEFASVIASGLGIDSLRLSFYTAVPAYSNPFPGSIQLNGPSLDTMICGCHVTSSNRYCLYYKVKPIADTIEILYLLIWEGRLFILNNTFKTIGDLMNVLNSNLHQIVQIIVLEGYRLSSVMDPKSNISLLIDNMNQGRIIAAIPFSLKALDEDKGYIFIHSVYLDGVGKYIYHKYPFPLLITANTTFSEIEKMARENLPLEYKVQFGVLESVGSIVVKFITSPPFSIFDYLVRRKMSCYHCAFLYESGILSRNNSLKIHK